MGKAENCAEHCRIGDEGHEYTMTFSLRQGGVVMSSEITHAQSSNIHSLAHILDTCALIFSSCALFKVYPTPLQVITERTQGQAKSPLGTYSVTYVPGLSILSTLSETICLYSQSSIAQQSFQRSPCSIPRIYTVYHIPFTSTTSCHLRP